MNKKIRVIVVDDSAFMRSALKAMINENPNMEVVVTASDPYDAREKIKNFKPDVMTLDIQMPKMDGLSFLEKIMNLRPMPVVMVSTLTEKGARETLNALALGAVDYITKPQDDLENNIHNISSELWRKIETAAKAKVQSALGQNPTKIAHQAEYDKKKVIAIGSSTGGVEALSKLVSCLPSHFPPILIVQHMPPKFTTSFAERLGRLYKHNVVEAKNNMPVRPNTIFIAPGDAHMEIAHSGAGYSLQVNNTRGLVKGHMPSVDVLFESCAKVLKDKTVGAILTGMGHDGAMGLKVLHDLGAKTLGQNKASCVVYGMPKAAFDMGAIDKEVSINEMATSILYYCAK